MNHKAAVLGIALALLALAGWLWQVIGAPGAAGQAPAPDPATIPATVESTDTGATGRSVTAARVIVKRDAGGMPIRWPPLPPVEAPLASIVDELKRRAAAGDPKAACRLAAEIGQCAQVKEQIIAMESRLRWQGDNPEAATRQRQRDGGAGAMVERGEQLLADDARCEGGGHYAPAEKYQWLRQAALAGHLPSLAEYASGNTFRMRDTLESLPALATYRTEAEAMARQAADGGDAGMVLALAQAYSPARGERFPNLLQQVVEPDPVESLARYLQAQALLPPSADRRSERDRRRLEQQLALVQELATPAQRAEAEALAGRRASDWKPALQAEAATAAAPGRVPALKPAQCDLDLYVR